ncbi:MAG TPA: DUF4332 domain-containing protein [Vicinamibacteria bacterium]|nr:DUF4332 domain-containing protein [Vicinamibacteria bacterium]
MKGRLSLSIGSCGLLLAFWGLYKDWGLIAQPFYAWAWWSYLLCLDGFVQIRTGGSLMTSRRPLLLPVLLWSTTFWSFFELLNLRLQNWYYVEVFGRGDEVDVLAGGLFGIVCFATVLTGLFETHDALGALGLFRGLRSKPRKLPSWLPNALQGLGVAMIVTALVFPYYLGPLVWGSLSLVLDPWNYRRGARSLLADWEGGRIQVPLRLLVAGFLCGLVWESFNFLAPQKWLYTVRGLEGMKLFEMPLLGFLGFPALAIDAFAMFSAVSFTFHGNETWEPRTRVPRGPRLSLIMATLPIHVVFWLSVTLAIKDANVGSIELRLSHLQNLSSESIASLAEIGIERPRQLLRALEDPSERDGLPIPEDVRPALIEEIHLLTFKGIGFHHGTLLQNSGVATVKALSASDPERLYLELTANRRKDAFPTLRPEHVRLWVDAARYAVEREALATTTAR